jgi:predicted DNA-binding WGR domain protein
MRRFEFKDGKSNKFWEIEVRGSAFVTRHGRIGTDGRETSKPCGSPAMAERQAASQIASKLKKGYVEVDAEAAAAPPPTPQDDTPQGLLEHKLIADPQAFEDWLVYADTLTQAGDPRGELVNIGVAWARHQASGEKKPSKELSKLLDREDELLAANAEAWFGKLVSDDAWRECFAWSLECGFWGRIRLWVDYDHDGTDIPKALAYALAHPSAKFLRELVLGLTSADGSSNYDGCIKAMTKHGSLPSLRRLYLGDFVRDESEISWVQVGSVGRLWPLLPNLESLTLKGAGIDLGNPKSSSLKSLTLRTGGLPGAAADSLARAELPALQQLSVWFGTRHYNGSCSARHVQAILNNATFANLRHLGLANADFADELATEVVRAELPKSLESLDLSMGTMTDTGAERLLRASSRLAALKQVDLSKNYLSPDMCKRLARELGNVDTSHQKQGDDEDRFVSVGE